MGVSMLQTSLFFIAATIVALIVVFVIRKANHGYGPHWAVVILVLVLAGNAAWFGDAWAKQHAIDRKTASMMETLEKNKSARAMRSSSPEDYEKLVKAVADSAEAPETEREERVRTLSGPIIASFTKRQVNGMNDEIAVKFGTIMAEVFVNRGRSDPSSCLSSLKNIKPRDSLPELIGAERSEALMMEVMSTPVVQNPRIMDMSQVKQSIMMAIPVAATQAGIQFNSQVKPSEGDVCIVIGTALGGYMKAWPRPDAAALARGMLTGGGSTLSM